VPLTATVLAVNWKGQVWEIQRCLFRRQAEYEPRVTSAATT
jgi:hypothetical protein